MFPLPTLAVCTSSFKQFNLTVNKQKFSSTGSAESVLSKAGFDFFTYGARKNNCAGEENYLGDDLYIDLSLGDFKKRKIQLTSILGTLNDVSYRVPISSEKYLEYKLGKATTINGTAKLLGKKSTKEKLIIKIRLEKLNVAEKEFIFNPLFGHNTYAPDGGLSTYVSDDGSLYIKIVYDESFRFRF